MAAGRGRWAAAWASTTRRQSSVRRHQGGDKLCLTERFGQRGVGLHACFQTAGIAGSHDDANALTMQPRNQLIGPLAAAQMNVDHRSIGKVSGGQAIGIRGRRDRSGHVCGASLQ